MKKKKAKADELISQSELQTKRKWPQTTKQLSVSKWEMSLGFIFKLTKKLKSSTFLHNLRFSVSLKKTVNAGFKASL